jgi:hypothetical protein
LDIGSCVSGGEPTCSDEAARESDVCRARPLLRGGGIPCGCWWKLAPDEVPIRIQNLQEAEAMNRRRKELAFLKITRSFAKLVAKFSAVSLATNRSRKILPSRPDPPNPRSPPPPSHNTKAAPEHGALTASKGSRVGGEEPVPPPRGLR